MARNHQNPTAGAAAQPPTIPRPGLRRLGYALVSLAAVSVIAFPVVLRDSEIAASDDRITAYVGYPIAVVIIAGIGVSLVCRHRDPNRSFHVWHWAVGIAVISAMTVMTATSPTDTSTDRTVSASGSPSATIAVTAPPSKVPISDHPTTARQPARRTFSPLMVRARGVTKQDRGGQSNVRFVADSTDASEVERLAIECVQYFTKQTRAAYCYAYGTEADYGVKAPGWTPDTDAGIASAYRPCWVMQGGQSLASDHPEIVERVDQVSYGANDCPGGVRLQS